MSNLIIPLIFDWIKIYLYLIFNSYFWLDKSITSLTDGEILVSWK